MRELAEEEVEEEQPVLCLKIPDEDEVVFEIEQKEIRKERRRRREGRGRERTSAMFARRCLLVHPFGQTHAYSHERETVRM